MLLRALPIAIASSFLTACGEDLPEPPGPTPPATAQYQATIRRTSYGIPHIKADDLGSLGFGAGYAAAQDYGCWLADQIVKVKSERAKTFGPGDANANVDSDFTYLQLGIAATAKAELSKQPADVQELVKGYVAGYDKWVGEGKLPAPCAD